MADIYIKKGRSAAAAAMMVLALFGCSLNDEHRIEPAAGEVKLLIGQALSGMGATPVVEGEMGLYLKQSPGYAERSNVRYKYAHDLWIAADEKDDIIINNQTATIIAYYPYSIKQPNTGTIIDLTPCVRSSVAPADLWYSAFQADNKTDLASLSLSLKQAYSRIRFTFTRSATYPEQALLYGFSMSGIYTSGKLNALASSSSQYSGDIGFVPLYYYGDLPISGANETPTAVLDLLLVPQLLSSELSITATIAQWDSKTNGLAFRAMNFELKPTLFKDRRIEPGQIYDIEMTVDGKDISLTGAFLRKEEWVLDSKDLGEIIIKS